MFIYWIVIIICLVKVGIFFEKNEVKIVKKQNKKIRLNKNVLPR
ncbi:hypothetical protein [Gemelliphila palaticanis]|nr:hypothetical protein [Gemella palaticanis]